MIQSQQENPVDHQEIDAGDEEVPSRDWQWKPCRTERSEEHTSELQSPCNLVCRLLLEKKKHKSSSSLALASPPVITSVIANPHITSHPPSHCRSHAGQSMEHRSTELNYLRHPTSQTSD